MAWIFRRSINLGPLRINCSKKGVGLSAGGRGFRVGRDAQGREYSQVSIPGTGIYNRQYYKGGATGQHQTLNPVLTSPATIKSPPSLTPQLKQNKAQVSPSAKYFLLLAGIGGFLWILLRFVLS
jgi:hypothetical protein